MSSVNNSINNMSYSMTTTAGLTVGSLSGGPAGIATVSTTGVIGSLDNPAFDGYVLISKADQSAPVWAGLTQGSNITITRGANSITIAATSGGITNTEVTADTALVANNGYIANKAGTTCSFSLPASCAVGDVIDIIGKGATGWIITQASGQQIILGNASSTLGATGTISSSNQYDCISLICTVANTIFTVKSSIGNITLA